jgi:hypothetical protein
MIEAGNSAKACYKVVDPWIKVIKNSDSERTNTDYLSQTERWLQESQKQQPWNAIGEVSVIEGLSEEYVAPIAPEEKDTESLVADWGSSQSKRK